MLNGDSKNVSAIFKKIYKALWEKSPIDYLLFREFFLKKGVK